MIGLIIDRINDSLRVKQAIIESSEIIENIVKCAQSVIDAVRDNKKLLLCGNGGSAADAQHIAAELQGRFYIDRAPLSAIALNTNTSIITSVGNDYGFSKVFSRQIQGLGNTGDVLIGISTSGNSENIIEAFHKASELRIKRISFTGESGGSLKSISDICIRIPSSDTPRIQEAHILIGHIICELVEKELFN